MSSPGKGREPSALGRLGLAVGSRLRVACEHGDGSSAVLLLLITSLGRDLGSDTRVSDGVHPSRGARGSFRGGTLSCCREYPGVVRGGTDLSPTLCLMNCISRANSSNLLNSRLAPILYLVWQTVPLTGNMTHLFRLILLWVLSTTHGKWCFVQR